MNGALTYLDEQIESIKAHFPAAVEVFDPKSVHQARVATRRLKAGLELLAPLMNTHAVKPVTHAGRRIRRRLGPLRDLDVMIEHLSAHKPIAQLAPALAWVIDRLEKTRRDARLQEYEFGKKPGKLVDRLDDWWKIRHALETEDAAFEPLLRQSLHERFERFREEADTVSEEKISVEGQSSIDVHQLRIAGKALRYTFELASAYGLDIPKRLLKQFKKMQESLGEWHDFVVLTETTLQELIDFELPLHNPELATGVLDLGKTFVRTANRSLLKFKTHWNDEGASLVASLHESVPLTVDVSNPAAELEERVVNESETDRDPSSIPEIQPPASAPEASEEAMST